MATRAAYIAQRVLDLEDNVQIAPGEEVKDFESWEPSARHALLSLEWVKLETIEESAPKKKSSAKK